MAAHNYRYLTHGDLSQGATPIVSRLVQELSKAQKKAPPKQWQAFIKGLSSKGVKGAEIEETEILSWLESQETQGIASVSRTDLLAALSKLIPIIKELDLSRPIWGNYRHKGANEQNYTESLYIWNSEKDCYNDRLAEIRFEIEQLDFDLELLAQDPGRVMRLYQEQQSLKEKSKTAKGHSRSHFSGVIDPDTGDKVSNLIAHARTSVFDDVFFVQEVQSDWAQAGRRERPEPWTSIPKGPFVTSTDLWTGLVFRRLMQRAAQNPNINRFAWIVGSMRNGGKQIMPDKLDDFYKKIIPKLVDKTLAGTGMKTTFVKVKLGDQEFDVPGFELTDKVREKLIEAQPLYSHDILQDEATEMTQEKETALVQSIKEAHEMLGSGVHINLAAKVLDVVTGKEVAGRQIGRIIEASLRARNPAQVIPHESWHYAYQHLIGPMDQEAVDRAFADGTYLNSKVRMAMVRDGAAPEAVAQCDDCREAAAHGFALWTQGKMEITVEKELDAEYRGDHLVDRTVGKIFKKVEQAYIGLSKWVKRKVGETQASQDVRRVEEIFEALKTGVLAQQEQERRPAPEEAAQDAPVVIRMRQRA